MLLFTLWCEVRIVAHFPWAIPWLAKHLHWKRRRKHSISIGGDKAVTLRCRIQKDFLERSVPDVLNAASLSTLGRLMRFSQEQTSINYGLSTDYCGFLSYCKLVCWTPTIIKNVKEIREDKISYTRPKYFCYSSDCYVWPAKLNTKIRPDRSEVLFCNPGFWCRRNNKNSLSKIHNSNNI